MIWPASVWVATTGVNLTIRERGFIAWITPRGVIAAAIASITAATLDAEGIDGGGALRALVFLTIAGTVLLSGVSARGMVWLLGLLLSRRDCVAVLGATGLGLALATELRRADVLEERTMLRAQPALVGTAVGTTFNEHLNSVLVRPALELFDVPSGFVDMDALIGDGCG